MRSSRFLLLVVFLGGMTTMAIEMSASRLIGEFFGSPLTIWAILIGMVMIYLTAGYTLGGRLADRRPDARYLYGLVGVAAFATGLIPAVSRPLLDWAQRGLSSAAAGFYIGALVGVLTVLARRGINMKKLESRPLRSEKWKYVFFADLECDLSDTQYDELKKELSERCHSLQILGSYPAGPYLSDL